MLNPELIDILIKVYFSINIFFSGFYFGQSYTECNSRKSVVVLILFCVALIYFALPIIILDYAYAGLKSIWDALNAFFQIGFFFTYHFTKKWDNLEKNKLNTINRISTMKDDKSLKNRIYKYCTTLINKRNNFIYNPNNDSDDDE